MSAWRSALAGEAGTVTAEFALTMPAVVVVLVLALGALQAGSLQIRVVDAASLAARTLARSESHGEADSRISALLAEHTLQSSTEGDLVCATVSAPVTVGWARFDLRVTARSCSLGAR